MTHAQKEKYKALSRALEIILEDSALMPGSHGWRVIRDSVADIIDKMGPEKALEEIERTKAHHRAQAAYIEAL